MKISKITAKLGNKTYTWKLFACEYVLKLIKRDKRLTSVKVFYENS